jgi:hypothetical protein
MTHTQEYLDEWKANAKKYSLNYVDIRVYKWESKKKIASKKESAFTPNPVLVSTAVRRRLITLPKRYM